MSAGVKNYNYGLVHKEPNFKHACCVLLTTKEDARKVMDLMQSILDRYGVVTKYDLYLAIGAKTSTEDDLVGWENLESMLMKPTFNNREIRLILPKMDFDGRDYM